MRCQTILLMCLATTGAARGQAGTDAASALLPFPDSPASRIRAEATAPIRVRSDPASALWDFRKDDMRWPARPALRGGSGRSVLTFLGGLAGSLLVGWSARSLVHDLHPNDRVKGDAGYSREANAAFILGSAMGATIAVYAVGRKKPTPGTLTAAAAGSALGTLAMLPFADDPYLIFWGSVIGSPAQALGATWMYESSRRSAAAVDTNRP